MWRNLSSRGSRTAVFLKQKSALASGQDGTSGERSKCRRNVGRGAEIHKETTFKAMMDMTLILTGTMPSSLITPQINLRVIIM